MTRSPVRRLENGDAPASRRLYIRIVVVVVIAAAVAACKTQPSPWSPEVDELYHQMYGPIIDGG